MQILRPRSALFCDLHGRFNHQQRSGDIGFPAIKILQIIGIVTCKQKAGIAAGLLV